MPSSFATRAIGRDVSITILTASSLNSDEKLFFGRGNYFTFPEVHPNGWTVRKLRGTPVAGDCRAGLALAAALGRSGAGEAGQGLAAAPAGSGREPGGGAALGFFLPGVPCGEDALVADDQQRRGEQHEGCQAHEAAPAAGDVAGGGVLDGGEAAFGAGAAGLGAAPGRGGVVVVIGVSRR